MIAFKKIFSVAVLTGVLAGCVESGAQLGGTLVNKPSSSISNLYSDPATQALFALPLEQYYQNIRVSHLIAQNCSKYQFDAKKDLEINERRNETGRGSFATIGKRKKIKAGMAAFEQQYREKYQLDSAGSKWCAAGDREKANQSAISALLN